MHAYGFLYLLPLACFFEGKELWLLIYRSYSFISSSNNNIIDSNGNNNIDYHNIMNINNSSTSIILSSTLSSIPNQQLLELSLTSLSSSSSLQDDNNNEVIILLRLFLINSIAFTLYNLSGAFVLQYSNLMIHSVINTFRYIQCLRWMVYFDQCYY